MAIKHTWTVVLCSPSHWRLLPLWHSKRDAWPRFFQFHWLFFYCQRVSEPT